MTGRSDKNRARDETRPHHIIRLAWGLPYAALGALGLVIGAWFALGRAPWLP